jgi:RNA recognition motif-containing protein
MNVFIRNLNTDLIPEELEKKCSEIGEVKSTKISLSTPIIIKEENGRKIKVHNTSAPPVSNGYGFVCFQNPASAKKAVEDGKIAGVGEAIAFNPKDPREIRNVINNIYVKNFNPSWGEKELFSVFSHYGDIKSAHVQKRTGKDGIEKPFAFICYEREGDRSYGPKCA